MGEGEEVSHTYAAPGIYTVTVTGADGGVTEVKVTVTLPPPTNLALRGVPAPQRVDLVWDYPNFAYTYKQDTNGLVDSARAWTSVENASGVSVDRTVALVGEASTKFSYLGVCGYQWANAHEDGQLPVPMWARFYVRLDALPDTATSLAWFGDLDDPAGGLALSVGTDGLLSLVCGPTGAPVTTPTDLTLVTGRWVRVELGIATTSDSLVEIRLADGDDPHGTATRNWSGDVGADVAYSYDQWTFGAARSGAPAADWSCWQDLWEVSTLGWIGPYAVTRRAGRALAAAGPVNFRIYRAGPADQAAFELIGTVTDPWVRTYTDTSLEAGGPYTYQVTAIQDGQESPPSNQVVVATTVPAPTLRQWRSSQNGHAYLAWDVPASEWRWYNNAAESLPGRRPFDLVDQDGGGTVTDDTSTVLLDGHSLLFALPATDPELATARVWWKAKASVGTPHPPVALRLYGYVDQLPPTDTEVICGLQDATGGTDLVKVLLDSTGLLWVAAGGTTLSSGLTVAAGSWWRLEVGIALDGPTIVTVRLTQGPDPHAQTFTEAKVDLATDLTALDVAQAWFGIVPVGEAQWQINQDLWAGSTQGWCGPYPEIENSRESGTLPVSYTLQRKDSASAGDFTDLATITDPWQTTYDDNPLTEGVTYTYRVNATYGSAPAISTDWSNEVAIVARGAVPEITSISPNIGLMDGGTQVTITGINFTGATGVDFGTNPGTALSVTDDYTIVITSPAGSGPVAVDVKVTTPGGTATKVDGYAYKVKDLAQLATLGATLEDLSQVAPTLAGLEQGTPQS